LIPLYKQKPPLNPSAHILNGTWLHITRHNQVVELFQLWDLEQRHASRKVAEKHTFLLAAVLRCLYGTAQAQTGVGALLSRRLLHERATELHSQLISSNQGLATATLRLLKALVRLGPGPAWEVVLRFSLTAKPVLHLFAPSSSASRPVAVALAAALVRCPDPSMGVRLLSTDRVLKAVFKSLLADRARTVEAWLAALACALRHPHVPLKIKRRLVTTYRLEQLRRLLLPGGGGGSSGESKGPPGQRGAVRRELVCRLIHILLGGRAGTAAAAEAGRVRGARGVMAVVRLLLALAGSEDGVQQQLALEILEAHPDVAAPFMRRFNQTWEARPSFMGLSSYLFLARLLRAEPPDAAALFALEDDAGGQGQQQRGRRGPGAGEATAAANAAAEGVERVLGGLIPSGLGKRELTKAILGQSPLLQRTGLLLLGHALRRAQAAIAQAPPSMARALRLALPHRLPDLQAVLAVRSRCGGQGAAPPPTWGPQMLTLVLRVLRAYQAVVPEAVQAFRFDFLRLLPEQQPYQQQPPASDTSGVATLPAHVQWELLCLLDALGPERLQWLPPDTQAWSSSSSSGGGGGGGSAGVWGLGSGGTAFRQVLRLFGQTRDRRIYFLVRRVLLGVIQSKVGDVDTGLGDALLDAWDGGPEAAALLESALRLAANRPYPFSLLVLKLLSPSAASAAAPPSPVLVALLLLVTRRPFSGEEEEALRAELHVFGLSWDALKGRFAASPPALSYVRAVLRAQRGASASVSTSASVGGDAGGRLEALDVCVRRFLLDAAEGTKGKAKGKRGARGDDAEGLREALVRYREVAESSASSASVESALWELEQAMARVPLDRLLQENESSGLLHELVAVLSAGGQGSAGLLTLAGYVGRHATDTASVFDALAAGDGSRTLTLLPRALPLSVLVVHHAAAATAAGKRAGAQGLAQYLQHCTTHASIMDACLALAAASQRGPPGAAQQSSLLRILAQGAIRWALGLSDGGGSGGGGGARLAHELRQGLASEAWASGAWFGVAALLRVLRRTQEGPTGLAAALAAPGKHRQTEAETSRRALAWCLLFQETPTGPLLQRLCAETGTASGGGNGLGSPTLLRACLQELLVAAPAVVEGLDVEARLRVATTLFLRGEAGDDGGGMAGDGMAGLLLRLAATEGQAPSIVPELAARGDIVSRCWTGLCTAEAGADGGGGSADATALALILGRCLQEVEAARRFVLEQLQSAAAGSRRPTPLLLAPALAVLAARVPVDEGHRRLLLQCADALGCAVFSAPGRGIAVGSPLEAWMHAALQRLLQRLTESLESKQELCHVVQRWQGLLAAALTTVARDGSDQVVLHVPLAVVLARWMISPSSPLAAADKASVAAGLATTACRVLERCALEVQEEEEADSGGREAATAAADMWLQCLRELSFDAHAGHLLRDALAAAEGEASSTSTKKSDHNQKRGRNEDAGEAEGWRPLLAALRGLAQATSQRLEWTALVMATTELLACVLSAQEQQQQQQQQQREQQREQEQEETGRLVVEAAFEGFQQGVDSQARLVRALQGDGQEVVLRLLLLLVSRLGRGDKHGGDGDGGPSVLQHGRRIVPALLATYRASLAPADLLTLRLLWMLAAGGLRLGLSWFRLGASAEEVDHAMEHGRFPNRMMDGGGGEAAAWLLEWVDPERVFASLEAFPLHRPLFPSPVELWERRRAGAKSEEVGKEEEEEEEGCDAVAMRPTTAATVYDPAFLLPILDGLLRHQSVSIRTLVDSCLLPYCLVALASARRAVRACAYSCLYSVLHLLERAPRNDPGSCLLA
jgi:hypothetical protein